MSEFLILKSFWCLFLPFQIISNLWTSILYCRYYTPANVLWTCLSTSAQYTIYLIRVNISFSTVLGWPLPSQNSISWTVSITRTSKTFSKSVCKITVSLPLCKGDFLYIFICLRNCNYSSKKVWKVHGKFRADLQTWLSSYNS